MSGNPFDDILSAGRPKRPVVRPASQEPVSNSDPAVLAVSAVIFLAIVALGFKACEIVSTPVKKSSEPDRADAMLAAERMVLQFVEFKHDASFGWWHDVKKTTRGRWKVTGTITTKNIFGASLTHDWECILSHDKKSGWKYHYISLAGQEFLDESSGN